jgi:hypothetical protein
MGPRKGRRTKIKSWTDEDRRVIAGMRIAMRMAKLPENLVQMLSPDDLRRMSLLERAAYLRLEAQRKSKE